MEKNTVRIQNVTLGAGIPKVCVPVMGKDLREWTEAATAAREQADLIELRLDSVSPELDATACGSLRVGSRKSTGKRAFGDDAHIPRRRCGRWGRGAI